jgi:hypothetical protein
MGVGVFLNIGERLLKDMPDIDEIAFWQQGGALF